MNERGASYDKASALVALNCFGYSAPLAKLAEVEAGKCMHRQAAADMKQYRRAMGHMHGNSWQTGKNAKNAGSAARQLRPYDLAILDVIRDGMLTGEVVEAVSSKHPSVDLPSNMSHALSRLLTQGLISRSKKNDSANPRYAVWGPTKGNGQ